MSGRIAIEVGVDYFWDGNTLVGKSAEGIAAINAVMRQQAYPFIRQLCTWAEGSPENGAIVNFAGNFEKIEKAEQVLAHHAPISEFS